MGGVHGVKETKEGLIAIVALGAFVAARLKDGAQLDDAVAVAQKLVSDEAFKTKVQSGVDGLDKAVLEIKELDLADGLEILKVVPDLIAEVQAAQT